MKEIIQPIQLPNIACLNNDITDPVPLIDLMCPGGLVQYPCPVKVIS